LNCRLTHSVRSLELSVGSPEFLSSTMDLRHRQRTDACRRVPSHKP
jgi:hypothetical protein